MMEASVVHTQIGLVIGVVGLLAIACGNTPTANDMIIYGQGQGGASILSVPSGNGGSYVMAGAGSAASAVAVAAGGTGAKVGVGGRAAVAGSGAKAGAGGRTAVGGRGAKAGAGGAAGSGAGGSGASTTAKFSFFITSLNAMVKLSGSDKGFGGDLRYGEATGLAGADEICKTVAEGAVPGAGQKGWHAFLSTTTVNAKTRIGEGPWYDRKERLVALTLTDLLNTRPVGADAAISNDLPDENGVPIKSLGDNHDILTGSNASGEYDGRGLGNTCNDWTTTVASTGKPTIGHSWPRSGGGGGGSASSWLNAHTAPGCGAGVNLANNGGGSGTCVGCAGGYGAIYCFAMTP